MDIHICVYVFIVCVCIHITCYQELPSASGPSVKASPWPEVSKEFRLRAEKAFAIEILMQPGAGRLLLLYIHVCTHIHLSDLSAFACTCTPTHVEMVFRTGCYIFFWGPGISVQGACPNSLLQPWAGERTSPKMDHPRKSSRSQLTMAT